MAPAKTGLQLPPLRVQILEEHQSEDNTLHTLVPHAERPADEKFKHWVRETEIFPL